MKPKSIYFPGLNGLRAIAALIVMVFHTDQWSKYFGVSSIGFWNTKMQTFAVVLFFVLSGFLITYLLLREKQGQGTINFKKFYIRRVLRIWPVYYSVLLIGITLLLLFPGQIDPGPRTDLSLTITLYGIFLPNIGFFMGYCPDLIAILWSVGVEEQFYLFWPLLIYKARKVQRTLVLFLAFYTALRIGAALGLFNFVGIDVYNLLFFLPFDYMAIGGLAAYLFISKSSWLKVIYHPSVQIGAYLFFLYSVFITPVKIPHLEGFQRQIHALVYACIILNVSTNPKTFITLEHSLFNFLGKISYGIYAYHFIVLFVLSRILRNGLAELSHPVAYTCMLTAEVSTTVFVSYISYHYFESWFLKKKEKFIVINSSNRPAETRTTDTTSLRKRLPVIKQKNSIHL